MPLFGWQLVQLGHCVHVKLLTWPLHGFFHLHLLGTKHTFTWIFTCICFMHLLGLSHTFLTCVLGIAYAFASCAVHVCLACCPCVLRVSLVCALHVTCVYLVCDMCLHYTLPLASTVYAYIWQQERSQHILTGIHL